jgi:pseudaminic acid biosynthesis-associated methylase
MSKQSEAWGSKFGKEYTDRNMMTLEDMEKLTKKYYGVTRTKINDLFLGNLNRNYRILEVGCNIGNQLECLQKMGFTNLCGIDVSEYAVDYAKKHTTGLNIIHGNGLEIPFKDGYFDIVFTSGVLIHINEKDLLDVMKEIYRCSSRFIFGFEYFAKERTEINYRGKDDLLWKDNFNKKYCDLFPEMKTVKLKYYKYLENGNQDVVYLLRK